MTKRMRWIQAVLGAGLALLGIAASARVLVPHGGPRSSSVEGWMFLGPGLVTLGVLLLWTARGGGSDREREAAGPRLLLQLGLAFLAPVAAAWLWRTISGGELATYAWSVTAFTLGVPGAALGAAGAVLLAWRALR